MTLLQRDGIPAANPVGTPDTCDGLAHVQLLAVVLHGYVMDRDAMYCIMVS